MKVERLYRNSMRFYHLSNGRILVCETDQKPRLVSHFGFLGCVGWDISREKAAKFLLDERKIITPEKDRKYD